MAEKFNVKKLRSFEGLMTDLSTNMNKNTNKLLRWALDELSRRQQLLVTEHTGYSICPRCYSTLDREYIKYCCSCGQNLKWLSLRKQKYVSCEELNKRRECEKKTRIRTVKERVVPAVNEVAVLDKNEHSIAETITVDEIIAFISKNESVATNKSVTDSFCIILQTLVSQIQATS
jgi:hypothetical protein